MPEHHLTAPTDTDLRRDAGKHILMLIHDTDVTISDTAIGEIIRELTIDATRVYQSRQGHRPGRT